MARISAFFLLAGFIGSIATWTEEDSIFEMASNPVETARPGAGFIAGPVLIMLILPMVRKLSMARAGENPWYAGKRMYRARVVIAALLFVAGLIVLAVNVSRLDSSFDVKAGTYIAAVLLLAGLGATLAMWPTDLPVVPMQKGGPVPGAATAAGMAGPAPGMAAPAAPAAEAPPPPPPPPPVTDQAPAPAPEEMGSPGESAEAPQGTAPPMEPPPPPAPAGGVAAGWFPNPGGPGQRYWDGSRWTQDYSQPQQPPPPPPPPPGGRQGNSRRVGLWIIGGVVGLLVVVIAAAVVIALQENEKNDAGQRADAAFQRLDHTIINNTNRMYASIERTFGRLAEVTNANPYGGPPLARCTPLCERTSATIRRSLRKVEAVFRSSPGYLKRVYGRAYGATQRLMSAGASYSDALAEFARVHGASEYEGAAEFELAKQRGDYLNVMERRQHRALERARRHWYRYAERRWDLNYG